MNKKIKDYLYLYLGCEVKHNFFSVLVEVGNEYSTIQFEDKERKILEHLPNVNIKPILRKLSDLTDEELTELLQFGEHYNLSASSAKRFVPSNAKKCTY